MNHTFAVVGVCCDGTQIEGRGQTTYETLAATQLLHGGNLPRRVTLAFDSPTSFQPKGMHVPVPLPNLVFGHF